jgi:hypothetical protein
VRLRHGLVLIMLGRVGADHVSVSTLVLFIHHPSHYIRTYLTVRPQESCSGTGSRRRSCCYPRANSDIKHSLPDYYEDREHMRFMCYSNVHHAIASVESMRLPNTRPNRGRRLPMRLCLSCWLCHAVQFRDGDPDLLEVHVDDEVHI